MIRVLIVDDHPVVRQGLKQLIAEASDISLADEAGNAQDAIALVEKNRYDVILLDIAMPGMNGVEALKQIKRIRPRLPVLMISVYDEDVYAVRAIEAGASGYVTKSTAADELIEAIRHVCAGNKYIRASVAEKLATALDVGVDRPTHEKLSEREYQVLLMIADGKPVSHIAEELSLSPKTVSTYRVRTLAKMGLRNNAELMRYAMEKGLSK